MKIGVRKPSIKKSFKARRTGRAKRAVKQAVIPGYGKKGSGWIKNPKKAAYNKAYIKDLVKRGYKPCSDKDIILVNKILNTSTTFQRYENKDESIEDLINETSTTDDFDNYPNIIENKQNISSYSLNSTNYNDLIYQKYELYMQIQNMNYGIEENIKEYKSVLNKLLELFPDDYTYIELLNEINLKEEYLINFSKLQTCINILNNPRDLSAYLFTQIKRK